MAFSFMSSFIPHHSYRVLHFTYDTRTVLPAVAKGTKSKRQPQLTCTTNKAGANLSPYSKPLTKPNSIGTSLLVGRGACFLTVSLMLLCSDVFVCAPAFPVDSDVAVCACSIGAPSLVAGVDEPQPISEPQLAGEHVDGAVQRVVQLFFAV